MVVEEGSIPGGEKKYELMQDQQIVVAGTTLFRIRALKDFGNVKAGDLGGFLRSEYNLSQEGTCWVADDARVYDEAVVSGAARVFGGACVFGSARIYGHARVSDNAQVLGNAQIFENSWVSRRAVVFDYAMVYGHAQVRDNARVFGSARIGDDVEVVGRGEVRGETHLAGRTVVGDRRVRRPVSQAPKRPAPQQRGGTRKRGPKGAHKCTDAVLEFVAHRRATGGTRGAAEAHAITRQFGVTLHPRSLERALARWEKGRRPPGASK